MALIIVGALNMAGGMLALLSSLVRAVSPQPARVFANEGERLGYMTGQVVFPIAAAMGVLLGPLVIFGAVRMMKGRSHGLARTAAILVMVPCVSPCCVAGIPVGIWALVVLASPDVRAVFDRQP